MPAIYLVPAEPGDRVPGHELADPDYPGLPGLLDRPDVTEWLDKIGYGPDDPDLLVYVVTEDEDGTIPAGFEYLTVLL